MSRCIDKEVGELLTRFQLGTLSEEDLKRFRKHLSECDFCRSEQKRTDPIMSVMREQKTKILEDLHNDGISFNSVKEKIIDSYPPKQIQNTLWEDIARLFHNLTRIKVLVPIGSIAIGLLVVFLVYQPSSILTENPYLPHLAFEKVPFIPLEEQSRRGTAWSEQLFEKGLSHHHNGNYKSSIDCLQQAVKLASNEGIYWLVLGASYYLDRQAEPAIDTLTAADSLTDYSLRHMTRWYLAQSHLLNNDYKNAKLYLESIKQGESEYASKAELLMQNIQSIHKEESKNKE